jgi:hypothetical protein
MATVTLTVNPQKITVDSTGEHQIDFSGVMPNTGYRGDALIELLSGASVQFSSFGAITENSGGITTDADKLILPIKKGSNIRFKGGAGSEVFIITIMP